MKLDRNGAALSASYEALYLFSYPDPATGSEPITCGIGHTAAAGGIKPRMGQIFSMRQVMDIFRGDMGRVEARVNRAIHVTITQPRFNVCCSFDLNTGAISSGSFDDKINAGNIEGALATLAQYNKAAGHVMKGLINRRASEIAIFRTGKYPNMKILVHDRPGSAVRYISADALPWDEVPALEIDLHIEPTPPTLAVPLPVKGRENFIIDLATAFWRWIKK